MFVTKTEPTITVGVSEATVVSVQGVAAVPKETVMDNLDQANTLTYKWQYSDDNVIWTDIAASTTLAAGGSLRTTLEDHVFYRLRAEGNLEISMMIEARVPFASQFSFLIA